MSFEFRTPARIVYGEDALKRSGALIAALGTHALIVCDPTMVKFGHVERLKQALASVGLKTTCYDEVTGEPTDVMVDTGVDLYQTSGADFLVALGGGSPLDTMKAIALVVASGVPIAQHALACYEGELPAMVALPTTAGTGSEATQFTIITDTLRDIKMLITNPSIVPDLAIVDPQYTLSLPPAITAATGVDALCHAIEAYTSRKAQPLSDTFALSATQRIFASLATAYDDPGNVAARTTMALAATEAGIAFTNASVTLIHGMSRPIGALFHVPHGTSNAMIMTTCLRFALAGAYDRFATVARACGISDESDDTRAALALMDVLDELLEHLEIPTMSTWGIDRDAYEAALEKMADDALASGSCAHTWRQPSREELIELYRQAYR